MTMTEAPTAPVQTFMAARTVIAAVLISTVGEAEARRLLRLADLSPEVAK